MLLVLPLMTYAVDLTSFGNNGKTQQADQPTETIFSSMHKLDSIPTYQGVIVKIDMMNSVLEPVLSRGANQNYEASISVRLKERLYPTLEGGYAHCSASADGGQHQGRGGFGRVGMDINGLKKHVHTFDALLIGIRIGTGMQNYTLTDVRTNDAIDSRIDFPTRFRADCWGEVMLGCQVNIVSGLIMGWSARLKFLFTNKASGNAPVPYYIPGFGYRDNMNGGVSYYIGWRF